MGKYSCPCGSRKTPNFEQSLFMKDSYACSSFHEASAFTRRHVLKVGGLGLLGMSLNKLWAAESKSKTNAKAPIPRAKSIVFLYQFGGPSHIDMFDMKPDAPRS